MAVGARLWHYLPFCPGCLQKPSGYQRARALCQLWNRSAKLLSFQVPIGMAQKAAAVAPVCTRPASLWMAVCKCSLDICKSCVGVFSKKYQFHKLTVFFFPCQLCLVAGEFLGCIQCSSDKLACSALCSALSSAWHRPLRFGWPCMPFLAFTWPFTCFLSSTFFLLPY